MTVNRIVISGAYVATVDADRSEHQVGHVVVDDNLIVAVGEGSAPEWARDGRTVDGASADIAVQHVDGSGHLLTPGLVNTHHHLYQWLTRGYAPNSILFDWLVALYPTWARIDADLVGIGSKAAMGVIAKSGCTTVADHHYVFPAGGGDILGGIVNSALDLGVRLHGTRGSMDLGQSQGGLPPDFAVETTSAALAASAEAVQRYNDASFDSMTRIAIAPCSPFSVTTDLLREAAVLARDLGVGLHTHGAESVEEDVFSVEKFGMMPIDYLESVGWLGDDVWMAHCVHLRDQDVAKFAATGTGVAHCPSSNARLGAGIARVPDLLRAGAPVGLGVDGAASNESGELGSEIRNALLFNRVRHGADQLTTRDALYIATMGGARTLSRDTEIGSIEVGKLADLALWNVSTVLHAGIVDPVAALTLGAQPPLTLLLVNGAPVVQDSTLVNVDEGELAEASAAAAKELASRV